MSAVRRDRRWAHARARARLAGGWAVVFVPLLAVCLGCGDRAAPPDEAESETGAARPAATSARLDVHEALVADRGRPRHPADGAGRWWLVEGDDPVRAGGRGRYTFEFEVGPEGIAEGGAIYLVIPPFWGWSPPHPESPARPGFSEVQTLSEGVRFALRQADSHLLEAKVEGRALRAGERVSLVYGAGSAGARVDRYAEEESRFALAVDGNGDGMRALLDEDVAIRVLPMAAARLVVHGPSTARPGEPLELVAALLDGLGSAGVEAEGELEVSGLPDSFGAPARVRLGPGARARIPFTAAEEGLFRARVIWRGPGSGPGEEHRSAAAWSAESNPLRIGDGPRLLWLDLHGHSNLTDGTGTPEAYFDYARHVAGLDGAALTDHDAWGLRPLERHPELWERVVAAARAANEPGRFLALPGFEWTSWIHGHRHVVFFGERAPLLSSLEPGTDSPEGLWAALEGLDALSIPHHMAGGAQALDWRPVGPEAIEPVVELVSVHGSSDHEACPLRLHGAVAGNFARARLIEGRRFGWIGSGDSHDGHPGLAHLAGASGGLAGVEAESPEAGAVLAALRARRVFATSGPRIAVRATLGQAPMGSVLVLGDLPARVPVTFQVAAPAPLAAIELIGPAGAIEALDPLGAREAEGTFWIERERLLDMGGAAFLFLQVVQSDHHRAWTSPWFFD